MPFMLPGMTMSLSTMSTLSPRCNRLSASIALSAAPTAHCCQQESSVVWVCRPSSSPPRIHEFAQQCLLRVNCYRFGAHPTSLNVRFAPKASGAYGPRARWTSARACSQALWSSAWSASRARVIAAATASAFCDDTSPSLTSAAAIEPGVG